MSGDLLVAHGSCSPLPSTASLTSKSIRKLRIPDQLIASFDSHNHQRSNGTKNHPPNHLLETKIFSKLNRNDFFEIEPNSVHFANFQIGTKQRRQLRIVNKSRDVERLHIIPPQTSFFSIHFTKPQRLVPGMAVMVDVEFVATEYRYYYDAIRIHTKGETHLLVPIHAYPAVEVSSFPKQVAFPPTPVGDSVTKHLSLVSNVPVSFEFQVEIVEPCSNFQVSPSQGELPGNQSVSIAVKFSPNNFTTSLMRFHVHISHFNNEPLSCSVVGHSAPGLLRDRAQKQIAEGPLDPRTISPVERARQRRQQRTKPAAKPEQASSVVEVDGLRIPTELNTVHAVSQVLLQERGKVSIKELRNQKVLLPSQRRGFKENAFLKAVQDEERAEAKNQLVWQTKLGDAPLRPDERAAILREWERALEEYLHSTFQKFDLQQEYQRKTLEYSKRRTRRPIGPWSAEATFDLLLNDPWETRARAQKRFQDAARIVMVRTRVQKRLDAILGKNRPSQQQKSKSTAPLENDPTMHLTIQSVLLPTLPEYRTAGAESRSLGPEQPVMPVYIDLEAKYTFADLTPPIGFQTLQYRQYNEWETHRGYLPAETCPALTEGPMDEVVTVEVPLAIEQALIGAKSGQETSNAAAVRKSQAESNNAAAVRKSQPEAVTAANTAATTAASTAVAVRQSQPAASGDEDSAQLVVRPPEALFKRLQYHPMQIFNPQPGLLNYNELSAFSEVDVDYALSPINLMGRLPKLDHEEVIRGVMTWKKMASATLTVENSRVTLSDTWLPRWTDPLSSDIMPADTPPPLSCLPEEDKLNISEDSAEQELTLTPAMIEAEFPMQPEFKEELPQHRFPEVLSPFTCIAVNNEGRILRQTREKQLAFFINQSVNETGKKMKLKCKEMNKLKHT